MSAYRTKKYRVRIPWREHFAFSMFLHKPRKYRCTSEISEDANIERDLLRPNACFIVEEMSNKSVKTTPISIMSTLLQNYNRLPFPSCRRFLTPLQQTAFWKHSDKRRNCTKRAISTFATMFSTFCHRLSIQLWRFSMFWQNMFKVVCCRIWGIRLNFEDETMSFFFFKSFFLHFSQTATINVKDPFIG